MLNLDMEGGINKRQVVLCTDLNKDTKVCSTKRQPVIHQQTIKIQLKPKINKCFSRQKQLAVQEAVAQLLHHATLMKY